MINWQGVYNMTDLTDMNSTFGILAHILSNQMNLYLWLHRLWFCLKRVDFWHYLFPILDVGFVMLVWIDIQKCNNLWSVIPSLDVIYMHIMQPRLWYWKRAFDRGSEKDIHHPKLLEHYFLLQNQINWGEHKQSCWKPNGQQKAMMKIFNRFN